MCACAGTLEVGAYVYIILPLIYAMKKLITKIHNKKDIDE